jgi:hypothetical protein
MKNYGKGNNRVTFPIRHPARIVAIFLMTKQLMRRVEENSFT